MMTTILVTGAAGFIGCNFVRFILERRPTVRVVALDALTYAGNLENLASVQSDPRFCFVRGDICDAGAAGPIFAKGLDAVVNFAAQSHVDRSILASEEFVRTNVLGVQVLLDLAREHGVGRFLQISTDEVYGPLGSTGAFTEESPLAPSNPYSASKAAADLLVQASHRTFNVPTVIARCSNNYGPYQFPEKLIPLLVTNVLEGRRLPLYGDGLHVRDWIHVEDCCEGILAVLDQAAPGSVFNLGCVCELPNLEIARRILGHLGRGEDAIEYVRDRPGHDRRYATDIRKIQTELGWQPRINFEKGLSETIDWYVANEAWWRRMKSGDYLSYYEKQYGAGSAIR